MIIYKKGNLLDTTDIWIAHGCNAQGKMGSGVAKAIRDKWPSVYQDYHDFLHTITYWLKINPLGKNVYSEVDDKTIVNMITQEYYGYDGKRYVSYQAISDCFFSCFDHMREKGNLRLSIPKIGAGLGGGDWNYIEKIIDECLTTTHPDAIVTVWEL